MGNTRFEDCDVVFIHNQENGLLLANVLSGGIKFTGQPSTATIRLSQKVDVAHLFSGAVADAAALPRGQTCGIQCAGIREAVEFEEISPWVSNHAE